MSLKSRLKHIDRNLPRREVKDAQKELINKISKWLIENRHVEFTESLKQMWRLSIKGECATQQDKEEYDQIKRRLIEIIHQHRDKLRGQVMNLRKICNWEITHIQIEKQSVFINIRWRSRLE